MKLKLKKKCNVIHGSKRYYTWYIHVPVTFVRENNLRVGQFVEVNVVSEKKKKR